MFPGNYWTIRENISVQIFIGIEKEEQHIEHVFWLCVMVTCMAKVKITSHISDAAPMSGEQVNKHSDIIQTRLLS